MITQHLDNRIPSITGTFLSRQAPVGGLANQNCGGKDHNDTPAASSVRGGDRAGVVSSKTPAESVNGCANTLPVVFPVSGVRAANVAHLLNYLLLPFRANRGQQDPKRLLPIICFKRDGKQGCKTYANLSDRLCGIPPHSRTDFPGDITPARYGGARGTNRALP